jgi:hypothetical protein
VDGRAKVAKVLNLWSERQLLPPRILDDARQQLLALASPSRCSASLIFSMSGRAVKRAQLAILVPPEQVQYLLIVLESQVCSEVRTACDPHGSQLWNV